MYPPPLKRGSPATQVASLRFQLQGKVMVTRCLPWAKNLPETAEIYGWNYDVNIPGQQLYRLLFMRPPIYGDINVLQQNDVKTVRLQIWRDIFLGEQEMRS